MATDADEDEDEDEDGYGEKEDEDEDGYRQNEVSSWVLRPGCSSGGEAAASMAGLERGLALLGVRLDLLLEILRLVDGGGNADNEVVVSLGDLLRNTAREGHELHDVVRQYPAVGQRDWGSHRAGLGSRR